MRPRTGPSWPWPTIDSGMTDTEIGDLLIEATAVGLVDSTLGVVAGRFVAELSPEASEEEFGVAMLGGKREATA